MRTYEYQISNKRHNSITIYSEELQTFESTAGNHQFTESIFGLDSATLSYETNDVDQYIYIYIYIYITKKNIN